MKKTNKGFTLIELLVVIAIIGILSAVVLASLNTARNKGSDAAVKSQMASARSQAELFYDNAQTYTSVCADTQMIALLNAASTNGAGNITSDVCNQSSTEYAATAPLKTGGNWCIDSKGTSKSIGTAALGTTATVCP
jgi:prepilin-type N-terminal cleavage/methylation domain-containing protein